MRASKLLGDREKRRKSRRTSREKERGRRNGGERGEGEKKSDLGYVAKKKAGGPIANHSEV